MLRKFKELFNHEPLLVRSPGRVNLIGEHTDYNDGFVLPAAIDKDIVLAIAPNKENHCNLYATNMAESFKFNLKDYLKDHKGWPNYVMGVVQQLQNRDLPIGGFDCLIHGKVPLGAGMSSSAALECATVFALNHIFKLGLDRTEMTQIAKSAENEFVGVQCGIMDQFASMFGKESQAIKLDCRSLEYEYMPLKIDNYNIVLCDTKVKHNLASSEYNTRRSECEQGVQALKQFYPDIKSLRDVTPQMLGAYQTQLDDLVFQRCHYVVQENNRVEQACAYLEDGDLVSFGTKMYESHYGLRDEYEVSCPELDFLVELTENNDGVIGSRMMGGGFGGCTINLVEKEIVETFSKEVKSTYKDQFGIEAEIYVTQIANGSSLF